jgi:site-specific DNA-methyltransferase (adenine-specific)
MACAIEDSWFEIRDSLHWIYGQGFPKSLDVSKAIDKAKGCEREVIGARAKLQSYGDGINSVFGTGPDKSGLQIVTAPTSPEAKQWSGWGTALKPAHEPIVLARKPLVGTVAANVLEHGTGGINVDGCRIGDEVVGWGGAPGGGNTWNEHNTGLCNPGAPRPVVGRHPPNVLLGHACEGECDDDCPIRIMGEQSGIRPGMSGGGAHAPGYAGGLFGSIDCSHTARGDTGTAARFFPNFRYQAKASKRDRGPGNTHPTVKPLELMRWLCRLITPPGGTVLDPFAGSGTTLLAARA